MLPNPRTENLIAAARAVELNPLAVFQRAGRHIPEELLYLTVPRPTDVETPAGDTISLRGLSDADVELIATLIERLRPASGQP